jgi:hypothetical protein
MNVTTNVVYTCDGKWIEEIFGVLGNVVLNGIQKIVQVGERNGTELPATGDR